MRYNKLGTERNALFGERLSHRRGHLRTSETLKEISRMPARAGEPVSTAVYGREAGDITAQV